MNYSQDMCKKSLEILDSTAVVFIDPDWTEEEIEGVIADIRRAAKEVL